MFTGQSLPLSVRPAVTATIAGFVAPGGRLLVVATARDDGQDVDGPPWPLSRSEVTSFGLALASLETPNGRWRASYQRS